MTYGRSILEDLRLAEAAGMVFPEAEVEEQQAEPEEGDGLEALPVSELRESERGGGCSEWYRWAQTEHCAALSESRGWRH